MAAYEQPTDELEVGSGGRTPAAVAEPPLFAAGRRIGGRYVLERRLGHGGMAVVWLATDERLGRPVAIKVLSDTLSADHDYLGRFAREAKLAAALQHPNLVSVYDYDAGERPWLVMEYVEGGDLAALLRDGEPPPVEQLAAELLSALRHIHGAGVLHRDIKPQNVLVDRHGHARLTDFGIARPADGASLTRTGQVIGTEAYLAPEVMRGAPASERSDLFALGVVLADAARDGAGAGIWKLADRMRDPDPAARPESAAAALGELERDSPPAAGAPTQAYAIKPDPEAAQARPFTPTATMTRGRSGRGRRLAVAAVAALLAGTGAVVALSGSDSGDSGGGGGDRAVGRDAGKDSGGDGGGATAAQPATDTSEPATGADQGSAAPAAPTTDHGTDGVALNDQGFALVGEGRFDEAIPVLEHAVSSLRGSGDDSTYNYALYNLANAYLGAGRGADAIPLLEERMGFDDGQLGEVQATLDRAYAEAGQAPPESDQPKPPKDEKKPGKGPKGGFVPPPFQDEEGGDE